MNTSLSQIRNQILKSHEGRSPCRSPVGWPNSRLQLTELCRSAFQKLSLLIQILTFLPRNSVTSSVRCRSTEVTVSVNWVRLGYLSAPFPESLMRAQVGSIRQFGRLSVDRASTLADQTRFDQLSRNCNLLRDSAQKTSVRCRSAYRLTELLQKFRKISEL